MSGGVCLINTSLTYWTHSRIPRVEVEEMNRVVMHELNGLEPGCVSTIVGG